MKSRSKELRPGTKVSWNTSQGRTTGVVKKKLTSRTRIKGHKVAASRSNPEYLVQSTKSGRKAAHKQSALKKAEGAD